MCCLKVDTQMLRLELVLGITETGRSKPLQCNSSPEGHT